MTEEKKLNISIDTGNIQAVLKRMAEIEVKNENLTKQLEAQNSVISQKESENIELKTKLGFSGGNVTMSQQQSSIENNQPKNQEKVFEGETIQEAQEKMINWCKNNDKESYDKLMNQSANALANSKQSFEWQDSFDKNDRSIIGRTLDRHNQKLREKRGIKA